MAVVLVPRRQACHLGGPVWLTKGLPQLCPQPAVSGEAHPCPLLCAGTKPGGSSPHRESSRGEGLRGREQVFLRGPPASQEADPFQFWGSVVLL